MRSCWPLEKAVSTVANVAILTTLGDLAGPGEAASTVATVRVLNGPEEAASIVATVATLTTVGNLVGPWMNQPQLLQMWQFWQLWEIWFA